jgi:hypothetical protein
MKKFNKILVLGMVINGLIAEEIKTQYSIWKSKNKLQQYLIIGAGIIAVILFLSGLYWKFFRNPKDVKKSKILQYESYEKSDDMTSGDEEKDDNDGDKLDNDSAKKVPIENPSYPEKDEKILSFMIFERLKQDLATKSEEKLYADKIPISIDEDKILFFGSSSIIARIELNEHDKSINITLGFDDTTRDTKINELINNLKPTTEDSTRMQNFLKTLLTLKINPIIINEENAFKPENQNIINFLNHALDFLKK